MTTRHALVGIALVVMSLAFMGGRLSKRPQVVTVEKRMEVEHAKETDSRVVASVSEAAGRTTDRVVVRTVTRPGGERTVERWHERGTENIATTKAAAQEVRVEYRDRIVANETTKTIEAPAKNWGVRGVFGYQYAGGQTYGGQVTRRLVGPIEAGIEVTNRAAMIVVGMRF